MLYEQFLELYHAGKYKEALPVAEEYVNLAREQYGENHFEYAIALNNLAEIYRTQSRLDDAKKLFEQALQIEEVTLGPDHENVAVRVYNLARLHDDQENYEIAEKLLYRSIQIWEKKLGPEHKQLATALNTLAEIYVKQGREDEAEPLFEHSLTIYENSLGRDSAEVAIVLKNLATLYHEQGILEEARPRMKRALEIEEQVFGPLHLNVAVTLTKLGQVYQELGMIDELEPVLQRALQIYKDNFPDDHSEVTHIYSVLANLYIEQERFEEAQPLVEKSYKVHKQMLGMHHPKTALDLNNLAEIERYNGQYDDVEKKYKYALEVLGKAYGLKHLYVGMVFNNLAEFYSTTAKYQDALKLFNFALEIYKKNYGEQHIKVALIHINIADIYYHKNDDLLQAAPVYKHALSILEKQPGPRHEKVRDVMYNLGKISHELEHYDEAESFYKVVLKIYEETVGTKHNSVADLLMRFTALYETQAKYDQALPLYEYSLGIQKENSVEHDPKLALSNLNIANGYLKLQDWSKAYMSFQNANRILLHAIQNDQVEFAQELKIDGQSILPKSYIDQAKLAYDMSQKNPEDLDDYKNTSFLCAQLANSISRLPSLNNLSSRYDGEDSDLAELISDKLVLTTKWNGNYKNLKENQALPFEKQDKMAEATQRKLIENIDENLTHVNNSLQSGYQDYIDFLTSGTIDLDALRPVLRKDEALIHFMFSDDDGMVWVVTDDDDYWAQLEIGNNQLSEMIEKLSYGLDHTLWQTMGEATRGKDILSIDYNWGNYSQGQPLPFDLTTAHDLYRSLFGGIEQYIEERDLILVTPEPLAKLPLQVLVTDDKKGGTPTKYSEYRKVSWLGTQHSISTLPCAASLRALRSTLEISEPKKSFLGICQAYDPSSKSDVPKVQPDSEKGAEAPKKSSLSKVANFSRGVLIDTNLLRYEVPESDNVEEFQNMANLFEDDDIEVIYGKDTHINKLKDMEQEGTLRDFGILHFAGPVIVHEDAIGQKETAIELGKPKNEESEHDYVLKAGDILHYHFSTNWVLIPGSHKVLKDTKDITHIDRLARAFFFAGAQTLLVANWAVNSEASSQILKEVFTIVKDQDQGRAKALKEALTNLIQDKSRPWNCHPSTWGTFSIIGEGSAS